jgi:mannosyltransferase
MTRRTAIRLVPSLVPGLMMLAIALIGAGRPVLSWDEIATADVASRTPGQIWHLLQHVDGVLGPYYFLEHFWTGLAGDSEVALRMPSILAMAGTVALTGELGRRLYGPGTGALAGVLLCLLPSTSRYAAEARPYAFACFFSILAVLLLHVALDRSRPVWWVLYGLAVVLTGLSHVIALATLTAHAVLIGRSGSRRTDRRWTASAGPALLALAPMLWLGVHQRGEQLGWVAPLSTETLWRFAGDVVGSVASGWLLLGFAVLALCRPLPHRAPLAAMAVGPIVAVALLSLLVAPYWVPRYLLVVLAPLALLAAAGLHDVLASNGRPVAVPAPARTVSPVLVGAGGPPVSVARSAPPAPPPARRPAAPLVRTAAVLALLLCAVWPAQRAVRAADAKPGSDYRTAAAIVARVQVPGDAIVYSANSRTMRAGLLYYLRLDPSRPLDILLSRTAAEAALLRALELPPTAPSLAAVKRLWLYVYGKHPDPLTERPDLRAAMAGRFRLDRIWFAHNETLALYVRDA